MKTIDKILIAAIVLCLACIAFDTFRERDYYHFAFKTGHIYGWAHGSCFKNNDAILKDIKEWIVDNTGDENAELLEVENVSKIEFDSEKCHTCHFKSETEKGIYGCMNYRSPGSDYCQMHTH